MMSCTWFDFSYERVCHHLGCFGKELCFLIIFFVGHQVYSQRYPDTQLIDVVTEPSMIRHITKSLRRRCSTKAVCVRTPNLLEQFGGRADNIVGLRNRERPGGWLLAFSRPVAPRVRALLASTRSSAPLM